MTAKVFLVLIVLGLPLFGSILGALYTRHHQERRSVLLPIVMLGFIITISHAFYLPAEMSQLYFDPINDLITWWFFMGIPAFGLWVSITVFYYSHRLQGKLRWVLFTLGLCGIISATAFCFSVYLYITSPVGWPR